MRGSKTLALVSQPAVNVRVRIRVTDVDGKDRLAMVVRPLLREHRPFREGEARAVHDDEDRIAVAYM
jgi:hypothetical protein